MRRAAFLDRDGTIIEERHYLADPAHVRLLDGAVEAMHELAAAGFLLVIVTNQSGIARGLFTAHDFEAVQRRLLRMLEARGVTVAATFHCPHHPEYTGPCDCRKPGLGMYRDAAARLGIDLTASLYIGDRVSDVAPALETGGRGMLVLTGYGSQQAARLPPGIEVVPDLRHAASKALAAPG